MRPRGIWRDVTIAALTVLLAGAWGSSGARAEPLPGGTLDPTTIRKYVDPLTIPPAMPRTTKVRQKGDKNIEYFEIAVRQFDQQVLSTMDIFGNALPMTTVWSYGSVNHPGSFNYPAFTIEAKYEKPVRVKWINELVIDPIACATSSDPANDPACNYLPHLLPVDQTLHWANPPQECIPEIPGVTPVTGTDCRGLSQAPYRGPVPIVTHLHGAHVGPESDGYPEAWWLPAANNIPDGHATQGTHFGQFDTTNTAPGTAVYQYPNDQRAATLWFHDHTLGITRLNVYAGPAGFYLLRGGPSDEVLDATTGLPAVLPGPAPALGDLPGMAYYEIPIVIQDRSFNADGSLFYPDNRAFFEGLEPFQLQIPFIPDLTLGGERSDVSPIWNPEFFGNTMVVNGKTWPYLDVEPRQYRFRILNGSNSRFLILTTNSGGAPILTFHQIGSDGGFLPAPVPLAELLLGPAERADVIVDFSAFAGQTITLVNVGPDEPFGGGVPGEDFDPSDLATTGQVMQFRVSAQAVVDPSTPATNLLLPTRTPLGMESVTRRLSLNEDESETVFVSEVLDPDADEVTAIVEDQNGFPFGPISARLGTLDADGFPIPKFWMDPITENPALGATEVWEIYNFTADAHPIHIHLVQFEVLNRQALVTDEEEMAEPPARLVPGTVRGPEPWETGTKDTVIVYPGEVARVKVHFDIAGLFVWHCHILEHEDNEMMRPYEVVAPMAP